MATKIITKDFSTAIILPLLDRENPPGIEYLGGNIIVESVDCNDVYQLLFRETNQSTKYVWGIYVEDYNNINNWVPAGIKPDGEYLKLNKTIKQTTITAMLVTLKPVPTWLPVFDDEISTNTINELLTGST
mgnify:CR=1 FL=1